MKTENKNDEQHLITYVLNDILLQECLVELPDCVCVQLWRLTHKMHHARHQIISHIVPSLKHKASAISIPADGTLITTFLQKYPNLS